jgi:hypothetical protein
MIEWLSAESQYTIGFIGDKALCQILPEPVHAPGENIGTNYCRSQGSTSVTQLNDLHERLRILLGILGEEFALQIQWSIDSDYGGPFNSEAARNRRAPGQNPRATVRQPRRRICGRCTLQSATKEVIGIHVLTRSLFGDGTLRKLLLRVSPAKPTSAPLRF